MVPALAGIFAAAHLMWVAAAAAGTMFVLHGKHRAPLMSYPKPQEKRSLLSDGESERNEKMSKAYQKTARAA